jgi:hypothetical protein
MKGIPCLNRWEIFCCFLDIDDIGIDRLIHILKSDRT